MKKTALQVTNITNRKDHENKNGDELLIYNAYTVEDASSKSLYVCQSGIKKWRSPGWISGPAIYDHYIIHFLIDGEGTYFCRGEKYPIKAGECFLIEPLTEVSYQADVTNPYQYYWVGFNGIECRELLTRCGFSDGKLVISRPEIEKYIVHMDAIASIRMDSLSNQYRLLGHLYQMIGDLIQNEEQTDRRSFKYYSDAIAYIRQNACLMDLTASDVAAHIGLERSHLYRIFKENGQLTVKDIIMAIRMENAKLFLINTDQTIEYVANYSGFKNPSHFCKTFRKYEGISPLQYRQREKQNRKNAVQV